MASGKPRLQRRIGPVGAALLAFNGVVGAGVFVLPGLVFTEFGAFGPWLFPLFGLLMLLVVAPLAAVASRFDNTGGPVAYVDKAFGAFAGFQAGWLFYIAKLTAMAANVTVFAAYTTGLFPAANGAAGRALIITTVLAVLIAVNVAGVRRAIGLLNLVSVLKAAPLILFALAGLWFYWPALQMPASLPAFSKVEASALIILYAFVGFESAMVPAGETMNPRRSIPRGLVGTIAATICLYLLIQLAYTAVAPDGSAEAPMIAFGATLAGETGVVVMSLAALASLAGNLNGNMLTTPRITFAMAQQGSLPAWFGTVSARFATPANAILLFGLATWALALSGSFVWLAVLGTLARLILFVLIYAALPRLRQQEGLRARPALPMLLALIMATAICLWAMAQSKADAWALLAGALGVGTMLFLVARRKP